MHSNLNDRLNDGDIPLVALVGPPNAGKTTLYNWLTGSRFRTVNYPGATVEYSIGETLSSLGARMKAMDTPGVYSLFPKSPEEKITVDALFAGEGPRAVAVVVDATQLQRHLVLAKQFGEAGFSYAVALTMNDLAKERGEVVEPKKLSEELGVAVVPIDGRLGGGVKELATELKRLTLSAKAKSPHVPAEWTGPKTENALKEATQVAGRVITKTAKTGRDDRERTQALDKWLLHPVWGLLSFLFIMSALFTSIFWLAAPLMDIVDGAFGSLADALQNLGPGTLWADFLSKGMVAGMGSVLVFVPQILILFLGLGFLEDWGYLARGASIIDKPLSVLGLNGRSFVPLLSGYACAIPAMMAARTISNRRERLLTLFVIPLMSCSARLPVYALLLSFLFHDKPAWIAGLALTAIYLGSIIVGAVAALIAGLFLPKETASWFMMELPAYRTPKLKTVVFSAARRTLSYVQKAGPTIFVISLFIWLATTFPDHANVNEAERLANSYAAQAGRTIEPAMEPMGADWRVGVGLISAFAAREVFVSSMALIFNLTDVEEDSLQDTLLASMRDAKTASGAPLFTPASILGLIVFFMIALQCLTTVAVARREAGGWTFALVQLVAFTLAGYLAAVAIYQVFS